MRAGPRAVLGAGSVSTIAAVAWVAVALGPEESRMWLGFCGLMAVAAALQSVASEPRDLVAALACALPPVVALGAEGSPTWLIGPLGASLLLAAELGALSWECPETGPVGLVVRRRLRRVAALVSLGLVASVAITAVAWTAPLGGTSAVAAGAAALAGLGHVLLGRAS